MVHVEIGLLVDLIRHADTLISLQWYVLVLTLRLAVCRLFAKARSNLGKTFLHPKNMHSRTLMQNKVFVFFSKQRTKTCFFLKNAKNGLK